MAAHPRTAAATPAAAGFIPLSPEMVVVATTVVDSGADSVGAMTVVVKIDGISVPVGSWPAPETVAVMVMSRRCTFVGCFFLGTILVKVAFCSKEVCLRIFVTLTVVNFVLAGAINDVLAATWVIVLTVAI